MTFRDSHCNKKGKALASVWHNSMSNKVQAIYFKFVSVRQTFSFWSENHSMLWNLSALGSLKSVRGITRVTCHRKKLGTPCSSLLLPFDTTNQLKTSWQIRNKKDCVSLPSQYPVIFFISRCGRKIGVCG